MGIEHISLILKQVDLEDNGSQEQEGLPDGVVMVFRGVAASPGPDLTRMPISPGAKLVPVYDPLPLLFSHDPADPIGHCEVEGMTDGVLRVKGYIADTARGRDAATLIRAGSLRTMSVGLIDVRMGPDGISEARVVEVSLTPIPANPRAQIQDFQPKGLETEEGPMDEKDVPVEAVKAVVPYQDWPIYKDRTRPWNAREAEARIRKWAGRGKDPDRWGKEEWARYRSAFLVYDAEKPTNLTGYKLLICDVINGRVYAIPRGIFAAGAALANPDTYRGRGVDISDEDVRKARAHLARYYKKMQEVFDDPSIIPPWEDKEAAEFLLQTLIPLLVM